MVKDYNEQTKKNALENNGNGKNRYLDIFIFRTNVVIDEKVVKDIKNYISEKRLCRSNILAPSEGKKIIKFKSSSRCSMNGWYKFELLLFVRS